MIKFFRRIRKSLLSEGKTTRYFKYAIGEIILVVIGILIALQINNWNERKKEISKSRNYLKEFRKDLISDTLSFTNGLETLTKEMKAELWALNKVHYTTADADSILLAKSTVYFERKINKRTFNNVQNSGNAKLTGYDSLFAKLSEYYTTTNELVEAMAQWDVSFAMRMEPYEYNFKETIEHNNDYFKSSRRSEDIPNFPMISNQNQQAELLIAFATSVVGRNHFKENYRRHLSLERAFNITILEAKNLIELIDKELRE